MCDWPIPAVQQVVVNLKGELVVYPFFHHQQWLIVGWNGWTFEKKSFVSFVLKYHKNIKNYLSFELAAILQIYWFPHWWVYFSIIIRAKLKNNTRQPVALVPEILSTTDQSRKLPQMQRVNEMEWASEMMGRLWALICKKVLTYIKAHCMFLKHFGKLVFKYVWTYY